MTVLIDGVEAELRTVRVLSTSAAVEIDDALPEWAAHDGRLTLALDAEREGGTAKVRVELIGSADDGSFAARAELLLGFAVDEDATLPKGWPTADGHTVIELVWPHARAALQAAAFTVGGLLPLRMLPPGPHTH